MESRPEEIVGQSGGTNCLAIDAFHQDVAAGSSHVIGESVDSRPHGFFVPGEYRSATSFHIDHKVAIHDHHERATPSCWAVRIEPGRPGQCSAERVRWIGGRKHPHSPVKVLLDIRLSVRGPQTFNGARQGELRSAKPFDELAPAAPAGFLEMAEDSIQRSEPTRYVLGLSDAACDYAVAIEECLGERMRSHRLIAAAGRQSGPASCGHGGA
jgi:hypothetical protein